MSLMRIWPRSLNARLFISGALLASIILSLSTYILTREYRLSAEQAFDDRLDIYSKNLVGIFASQILDGGDITYPGNAGEQRFELPLSGWYWLLLDSQDKAILAASNSLTGETLEIQPRDPLQDEEEESGIQRGYIDGPDGQYLRVIERDIAVGQRSLKIIVAGDSGSLQASIDSFQWTVLLTQTFFGLALVISLVFQVRFGLRPLSAISSGLSRIRNGQSERLEGEFPTEINPLVQEINALIQSNQDIIERARTQVGNLAHALKTPLSVLTNEANSDASPFGAKVSEQVQLMGAQLQIYLDRARRAAQAKGSLTSTPVRPAVERLVRVMSKLYRDKNVHAHIEVHDTLLFKGESQDLEEMLGNLIENAFKYGASDVRISAAISRPNNGREMMMVKLDDNGPGIEPENRAGALGRGRRLDETSQGSGLGLSIVNEIAALYGGRIELHSSPLGGLNVRLELPSATAE